MPETVEVTRTYVEMLRREYLRPAAQPDTAKVNRVTPCPVDLYRFLYGEVGRRYRWTDRSAWTNEEIDRHLGRPAISIWALHERNELAGFFELVSHEDGSVEIAYFGLLDPYLGQGLGKVLLTAAVHAAWEMRPTRVWLHTCTLDHPAALPNYLARGFTRYKEEKYTIPTDS